MYVYTVVEIQYNRYTYHYTIMHALSGAGPPAAAAAAARPRRRSSDRRAERSDHGLQAKNSPPRAICSTPNNSSSRFRWMVIGMRTTQNQQVSDVQFRTSEPSPFLHSPFCACLAWLRQREPHLKSPRRELLGSGQTDDVVRRMPRVSHQDGSSLHWPRRISDVVIPEVRPKLDDI